HMAGRMAGAVEDLQGFIADGDGVAFLEPAIRLEGHAGFEAEELTLFGAQLFQPEALGLVRALDLDAQLRRQRGSLAAMVEVAVGDENLLDGDALAFRDFKDALKVAARIDDGASHGLLVPDQGAVLLKAGNGNNLEFHGVRSD